jgi:hypothetical protein
MDETKYNKSQTYCIVPLLRTMHSHKSPPNLRGWHHILTHCYFQQSLDHSFRNPVSRVIPCEQIRWNSRLGFEVHHKYFLKVCWIETTRIQRRLSQEPKSRSGRIKMYPETDCRRRSALSSYKRGSLIHTEPLARVGLRRQTTRQFPYRWGVRQAPTPKNSRVKKATATPPLPFLLHSSEDLPLFSALERSTAVHNSRFVCSTFPWHWTRCNPTLWIRPYPLSVPLWLDQSLNSKHSSYNYAKHGTLLTKSLIPTRLGLNWRCIPFYRSRCHKSRLFLQCC